MTERLAWGANPEQVGDLHLPAGAASPHGAVVLWHGGSYLPDYERGMLAPLAEHLAQAGWVAFNATYRRLETGGGVPETFDDALAAVDALRERLGLEDAPAGIGFSAGAPLALHAAAAGRLSRVVDIAGVSMLALAAEAGGPGSSVHRLLGAGPEAAPERYRAVDPAARLPLPVPLLIAHGDADEVVPVQMSRTYAERARAAGGEVELLEVAGAGHFDLHVPPTAATDAIRAFLAR